ncbi:MULTISPECIES: hypothetical protein [Pectobacterium]|nr:hypothetical protein [Pectobacterium carotovorum]
MIDSLKDKFEIIGLHKLTRHYNKINKYLLKNNISNYWLSKIHAGIKLKKIKNEDLFICNGFSVLGIIDMVKTIECNKILILRDTIEKLNHEMKINKKWLRENEDYIARVKPHFSHIYSFDINDCKKYDLIYLPQFLPYQYNEMIKISLKNKISSSSKSCYFIGMYNSHRQKVIENVYTLMQKNYFDTNFHLIDKEKKAKNYPEFCKNIPLTYCENIETLQKSDIILEINNISQEGITLRSIECLIFNKKLITTNKAIKKSDFYHPNRIFILDEDDPLRIPSFLLNESPPVENELLKKYSSDTMLETILKNYK